MFTALRNVRRWIGSNFMNDRLEQNYLTWAKTEYKNDWQFHYHRLVNEAKQRRNSPEAK